MTGVQTCALPISLPLHKYFDKYVKSNFIKKGENTGRVYYEYYPTLLDLELVNYNATQKSQYTNNASQNAINRNNNHKNNSQFEGDLAELIVTRFFVVTWIA